MVGVVVVIASVLGAGWVGKVGWPLVVGVAGMVLVWRNAPADEQARMQRLARAVRGGGVAAALLAGGLVALLSGRDGALLRPLGGVLLVVAAIVVVLGPWWLRIARDLVVERGARARAEERAEMASRVHDSVLQTLALIQRRASEPQQVIQLARAQERELRSWLFDGRSPDSMAADTTFVAGVRLIQSEVEAQHGVTVEVVSVGDCALDTDLRATLAAAREATVNAAKWSGVHVISIYAEVEPG